MATIQSLAQEMADAFEWRRAATMYDEASTERYCKTLAELDPVKAIRAIHSAFLQLSAVDANVDCEPFDNQPALQELADCLIAAGHIGFDREEWR